MRRVKLGDVEFTVVEVENVKDSANITDNPVESGQDVSDHIQQNPSYINIKGQMIGENAPSDLEKLKQYMKDGELLTYIGRNIYKNMVIEDIDRIHGVQNKTGYSFDIKLKQIRIAVAKEIEIKIANPATKKVDKKTSTKVKPTTNNGKQQPKQKTVSPTSPKLAKSTVTPGGTIQAIMATYKPEKRGIEGMYAGGLF
ncbi:phage baseplate protein [Tissierella praeacuta]|uniref:phage baseplate protein n=1 Tax=Tissierella praeacuta TaxID=43131 RepID=UPI003DA60114